MARTRQTAQPETESTATDDVTFVPETVDEMHARLTAQVAQAAATRTRDMTLLCDNCKGRLERAHAEDERNRNAVYPEGVTP